MPLRDHFVLMADYNRWMNARLFEASSGLSSAEIATNRGAFFGSVLGTLNHILVGDIIWLQRFAGHPAGFEALGPVSNLTAPTALSQILYDDFAELQAARQAMDQSIIAFVEQTAEPDYELALAYVDTRGRQHRKHFGSLLQHFFNHQTHHRGQVTTLLSQQGIDVGTTDLLVSIADS